MPHGHGGDGESPMELKTFFDEHLKGHGGLPKIVSSALNGNEVTVRFSSSKPITEAELLFTNSTAPVWMEKVWFVQKADVDAAKNEVRAVLPDDAKCFYVNLIDIDGNIVSSEHVER
jgi:hypothetical protein